MRIGVVACVILMAYGGVATLWLLAGLAGRPGALIWLAVPVILLAGAAAGYSAFLFGQAEGRDFWQSPLLLPHLLVAALAAGSAALLLVARATGGGLGAPWGLRLVLAGALFLAPATLLGLALALDVVAGPRAARASPC